MTDDHFTWMVGLFSVFVLLPLGIVGPLLVIPREARRWGYSSKTAFWMSTAWRLFLLSLVIVSSLRGLPTGTGEPLAQCAIALGAIVLVWGILRGLWI